MNNIFEVRGKFQLSTSDKLFADQVFPRIWAEDEVRIAAEGILPFPAVSFHSYQLGTVQEKIVGRLKKLFIF